MKRSPRRLPALCLTPLLMSALASEGLSQCPFNPQFLTYGSGCSYPGPQIPILSGSFAPSTCRITLTLTTYFYIPDCVGTQILVMGLHQVNLPPPLPWNCPILASLDYLEFVPPPGCFGLSSAVFLLPNDPGLIGLQVFIQGFVLRYHTMAPPLGQQTSGLRVML